MNANPNDWTILSMLEWGTGYFKEKGVPAPRLSIEWLLAEALDINRLDLYLDYDRPLSSDEQNRLRPLVKRRARHEPLQYISGYSNFLSYRFTVSPDVLIPRMETEQLTEIILDDHPPDKELSALDIGTGSGCIAISLKNERPSWDIHAIDVSQKALDIAEENATQHQTDVQFQKGDIKQNPSGLFSSHPFDLIVSNPPYVLPSEKETLEKQVKNYEPAGALFCKNISEEYKNIISQSEEFLTNPGWLYLEINNNHFETILSLFDDGKWSVSLLKDYDDNPRFIRAKW